MTEPPADKPVGRMVLDASALPAWLRAEPGAGVDAACSFAGSRSSA
jgi:hypothetical protein